MATKTPNLTGTYVLCPQCNRQTRVEINFENDELILYCGHHVAAPQLMPKTTITQYLDNIVRNAQEITQSRDATDDIADAAAAIIADIKDLRANYNLEPLRKGG